ncbi:hypothetical protein ON010_g4027 [Phytophthora cinnamomi]|nr:hypothetical protein ON010_g4027 [Phytophthora cinnamomi]
MYYTNRMLQLASDAKMELRLRQQLCRRPELGHLAGVHDRDLVAVQDRVDAVRDDQHGLVCERLADGGLDEAVGGRVHVGGGLVQHDDFAVLEQRAADAEQLALTHRQVVAFFSERELQTGTPRRHRVREVNLLQDRPDIAVRVLVERVEVVTQRTAEKHRVLWNDGEASSKIVQSDVLDVDAIDRDGPAVELADAEKRDHERTFAGSCATADSHLLAASDLHVDTSEHERQLWPILEVEVVERDGLRLVPLRL